MRTLSEFEKNHLRVPSGTRISERKNSEIGKKKSTDASFVRPFDSMGNYSVVNDTEIIRNKLSLAMAANNYKDPLLD